ncbi:DUF7010 family protein [Thalassobacillus pellis]|uniref:DUF7010 family protein n=1 Tax=Thalassobacillus pellis TaxID=748008 RepID=UPI00195F640A|nr:hypothetical protein [Thalassobacillus pellis]MBM7554491.1 hypothetical protein [Thalassobacillus pellis]
MNTLQPLSKPELRGIATGVLFMAFFGFAWVSTGIGGLGGYGSPWLFIFSLAIGIVLVSGGCLLMITSRDLPNQVTNVEGRDGKNLRMWFNIIFAAEGIAIAIAIIVCNKTEQTEHIPLIIAMIVGLHFLPLAYLFEVKIYYFTGVFLCLVPVITWIFVPVNVAWMDYQVNLYMAVVGFGSALILWGTSLAIWLMGRRLVRDSQAI